MTVIHLKSRKNDAKAAAEYIVAERYRSLILELDVWVGLDLISKKEDIDLNIMIDHINDRKRPTVRLENACTIFVLSYLLNDYLSQDERELIENSYLKYLTKICSKQ